MTEVLVYVGLGSNLDDPESRVKAGIELLACLPHSCLRACSSLYRSAPMGPQDQPDYVNAVVELSTSLQAEVLLDQLQAAERVQGRTRTRRWGPRTLDLDILLYGQNVYATDRLRVPHPGIAQRNFVLYPLAEVNAELQIPGLGSIQSLLARCSDADLYRLSTPVESAGQG
jgi:2-amino-4-hydroxy-6-hydroxymethyldihydropteridine diphosphokinase